MGTRACIADPTRQFNSPTPVSLFLARMDALPKALQDEPGAHASTASPTRCSTNWRGVLIARVSWKRHASFQRRMHLAEWSNMCLPRDSEASLSADSESSAPWMPSDRHQSGFLCASEHSACLRRRECSFRKCLLSNTHAPTQQSYIQTRTGGGGRNYGPRGISTTAACDTNERFLRKHTNAPEYPLTWPRHADRYEVNSPDVPATERPVGHLEEPSRKTTVDKRGEYDRHIADRCCRVYVTCSSLRRHASYPRAYC